MVVGKMHSIIVRCAEHNPESPPSFVAYKYLRERCEGEDRADMMSDEVFMYLGTMQNKLIKILDTNGLIWFIPVYGPYGHIRFVPIVSC